MNGNRFEIEFKALLKRWHWTFKAANNRVMANGPQEGYASRKSCLRAVRLWSVNAHDADVSDHVFEVLPGGGLRHIKARGRG